MKKTSRRTFGKQITGALAALPVGRILSAPTDGAAQAAEVKGQWNGAERFQAIAPALGTVMNLLVEEEGEYAPVMRLGNAFGLLQPSRTRFWRPRSKEPGTFRGAL